MSIGKRFVRLMRSNLNTLLDRTAEWERERGSGPLGDLTDEELEAELQRRRTQDSSAAASNSTTGSGSATPPSEARARRYPDQSESGAESPEQAAWREVDEAINSRYRTSGRTTAGRTTAGRSGARRYPGARRTPPGQDPRLAKLYAQLECSYGSDLDTVRRHYRGLMRKYHPDMHSGDSDKQRLATEVSQQLTMAYNELRRALVP